MGCNKKCRAVSDEWVYFNNSTKTGSKNERHKSDHHHRPLSVNGKSVALHRERKCAENYNKRLKGLRSTDIKWVILEASFPAGPLAL